MVRFIIRFSALYVSVKNAVYIPIWLDLLYRKAKSTIMNNIGLHSNMVRFIIEEEENNAFRRNSVYIPIWLDLLLYEEYTQKRDKISFTFQYG